MGDALQHRDRSRTEECAELAERQHATIQEPAGKNQPCNTDEHKQHACCRFGPTEKLPVKPLLRMMEPKEAARHIMKAIRRRSRVYAFPRSANLGLNFLNLLPPAVFDWCMTRAAATMPDLAY